MIRISVLVYIIFISLFANAGDSLSCKMRKMYLELSGGKGGLILGDPYMYLDPTGIRNNYSISSINSTQLNFGFRLIKKDCKIRKGVDHFIYIGCGITHFNYTVDLKPVDYYVKSGTGTTKYNYDFDNLAINVNKLNYSLFTNMGAQFPKGFYISNSIGFSYSTYINKKEVSYNEQITYTGYKFGSEFISPSNPSGYYWVETDETIERKEKNYLENKFNLYYSLQLGYKIKNVIPYGSAEMNYLDDGSTSIYIFRVGLRVLL